MPDAIRIFAAVEAGTSKVTAQKRTTMRIALFFLPALLCCQRQAPENVAETQVSKTTTEVVAPEESPPPKPPSPPPIDYDTSQWTELIRLDSSILLDLKYATKDNFVEERLYDCARCLLRPAVAQAAVAAHRELREMGLGLKMLDCYRPLPVQWKLWNKMPDRRYVTDPRQGSMHNRGAAVDLTIFELDSGRELDMGAPFDYFGREAYHTYTDLPEEALRNRHLLKSTMEKHGFRSIRTEWWHYSYTRRAFALSDSAWSCPEAPEAEF
jgi:D-alanyl-D-alanine dipeptidase